MGFRFLMLPKSIFSNSNNVDLNKPDLSHRQIGDYAEMLACQYLQQQGLSLVTNNYSSRYGEIDLILLDEKQDTLIFVEVRYRKNKQYGGAAMSITPKKQQKITKTALQYMQQKQHYNVASRFDVVAIEGNISGEYTLDWIINAF